MSAENETSPVKNLNPDPVTEKTEKEKKEIYAQFPHIDSEALDCLMGPGFTQISTGPNGILFLAKSYNSRPVAMPSYGQRFVSYPIIDLK